MLCNPTPLALLRLLRLLQASIISELEGSTLLDDQQGCGPAFRVLRNLAQNWMEDASKRNNM